MNRTVYKNKRIELTSLVYNCVIEKEHGKGRGAKASWETNLNINIPEEAWTVNQDQLKQKKQF